MNPSQPLCFVAESTLGRLCKWLRMAGFDTLYDRRVPDEAQLVALAVSQDRMVLTRTRRIFSRLPSTRAVFIACNDPRDQIVQVIDILGVRREDLRPLTRCLTCNASLAPCPRESVQGRVPEYIGQTQHVYRICPQCNRLYWPGSHAQRCLEMIDGWFKRE